MEKLGEVLKWEQVGEGHVAEMKGGAEAMEVYPSAYMPGAWAVFFTNYETCEYICVRPTLEAAQRAAQAWVNRRAAGLGDW